MTSQTYTEAQYSTPDAMAMVRNWLGGETDDAAIARVANYMSKTLRIGGMRDCRELVKQAIKAA